MPRCVSAARYDNGQLFGITRIGDSEDDRAGIWISQSGDGWSFTHRAASPAGNVTTIAGEATASAQEAAETLNGLLEEMVSRMPAPELSPWRHHHLFSGGQPGH
jgi:hypothetical protein